MGKLNSGKDSYEIGAAFLELAKAFNSIAEEIFLKKNDFQSLSTETFPSHFFLTNWTQCVKLGIELLGRTTVKNGAPQGLVLGPLFCIFINECSEILQSENDIDQPADYTIIVFAFVLKTKIFLQKF